MRERVSFDLFVLPFVIGMVYVLVYFAVWVTRIVCQLPKEDRIKLGKSLFSRKIFFTLYEILMECLIHRKIWKTNKFLGFMHSSIAFGWFMIIILGHVELWLYTPNLNINFIPENTSFFSLLGVYASKMKFLYYPIFYRYFVLQTEVTLKGSLFFFLMDFFLLIVLSGIGLAMYKRINSRLLGMRHTTKHTLGDTLAMYSLWAIFPCRLLAESFTSDIGGGGFLTKGFGMIFESFVSNYALIQPCWWVYSIALGVFMVSLPSSRYMHIPTEAFLILLRNAGIRSRHPNRGYASFELYSCSRCGICIDPCQMASVTRNKNKSASVYFIRRLRAKKPDSIIPANDCMMCMRCVDACPVGIDSVRLKNLVRERDNRHGPKDYGYVPSKPASQTDVLYFAGCMGHLTPSVPKSMVQIMKAAGERFEFMDKDGSICCGRPLMLTGQTEAARSLMEKNTQIILNSGAGTLVTSCPICYRIFKEEYSLANVRILHHTEYLEELLSKGRIQVMRMPLKVTYHDPCELGRGSGIYDAPRYALSQVARLIPASAERNKGLCCGGSIGTLTLNLAQRQKITTDAYSKLTAGHPDILATACPSCQKTFSSIGGAKVKDISQIIAEALNEDGNLHL